VASAAWVAARAVLGAGVVLMADATPPAWLAALAEARPAWVDTDAKAATVRPLAWVDTHARAVRAIAVRRASTRRRTAVRAAVGAVAVVAADVADRSVIYT
jgi:type II secretory pathway component HofQ